MRLHVEQSSALFAAVLLLMPAIPGRAVAQEPPATAILAGRLIDAHTHLTSNPEIATVGDALALGTSHATR